MAAGGQGSTPRLVMLETWLQESGVRRLSNFLISSGNLCRIVTLPFSRLTTPWQYIGQVHLPVMLETWLRESRVLLPTVVMLETWLRESGVPRLRNF